MIVPIYWGYYTFNTATWEVTRNKPGAGTRVGKVLKPYYPGDCNDAYVKPYINGRPYQIPLYKIAERVS